MSDEAAVTETTAPAETAEATAPEAPAPAAPPAEKTPEQAAADAAASRRAERISRAAEAEKRAAEARESRRVRQDIERAEQERARVAQERQAWEQQRNAEAEAIRKGGLEALKARGLDYAELTKEYIDQSSPEAQERARLRAEVENTKKQLEELTASQQRAAAERAYAEIQTALEQHADEYPDAYELSPGMFRAGVSVIARQMIAQGRQPTYTSVLKSLDESAKADHAVRQQRRSALQKRIKPTPSQAPTQPEGPNASRTTRTLTSQDGSQRASNGERRKTDAELDEEIARTIRPMLRQTD